MVRVEIHGSNDLFGAHGVHKFCLVRGGRPSHCHETRNIFRDFQDFGMIELVFIVKSLEDHSF